MTRSHEKEVMMLLESDSAHHGSLTVLHDHRAVSNGLTVANDVQTS